MIDKKEFITLFTVMMKSKGRTFDAETINIWYALLKDYKPEKLKAAFTQMIKTINPFPEVAHIIDIIDPQIDPKIESEKVFNKVLKMISRYGIEGAAKTMQPELLKAIRKHATLRELANMNEFQLNSQKKLFISEYSEKIKETLNNNQRIENKINGLIPG